MTKKKIEITRRRVEIFIFSSVTRYKKKITLTMFGSKIQKKVLRLVL